MDLIWHYTSGIHIKKIVNEENLKVSEAEKKFGIKPAVWFSKNPFWEPTATKIQSEKVWGTVKEQFETIGMIRIGIEFSNKLVSWAKYKYLSRIDFRLYKTMEEIGIEKGGDPKDWFCSFQNIPTSKWLTVEQYDGEKWVNIIFKE